MKTRLEQLQQFHSDSQHLAWLASELLAWTPQRLETVDPKVADAFRRAAAEFIAVWSVTASPPALPVSLPQEPLEQSS